MDKNGVDIFKALGLSTDCYADQKWVKGPAMIVSEISTLTMGSVWVSMWGTCYRGHFGLKNGIFLISEMLNVLT